MAVQTTFDDHMGKVKEGIEQAIQNYAEIMSDFRNMWGADHVDISRMAQRVVELTNLLKDIDYNGY